jgi:hypothetical protein
VDAINVNGITSMRFVFCQICLATLARQWRDAMWFPDDLPMIDIDGFPQAENTANALKRS